MGCSPSVPAATKVDGADGSGAAPTGGVLGANRGTDRGDNARRTVFANNGSARLTWCTPGERRWVELAPREYLDPGAKREARFVASRAAFGVADERVPMTLVAVTLIVDCGAGGCHLHSALAHVSPPQFWRAGDRLEADAIVALLADTNAVSVTRHGVSQLAVMLPVESLMAELRSLRSPVESEASTTKSPTVVT